MTETCRGKDIEINVIKVLSELLVNWLTCSSCGANWDCNWPHCPLLVIQGGVISGGPIHLYTVELDDCRVNYKEFRFWLIKICRWPVDITGLNKTNKLIISLNYLTVTYLKNANNKNICHNIKKVLKYYRFQSQKRMLIFNSLMPIMCFTELKWTHVISKDSNDLVC